MSYIGNTNTTQAFTPAIDYFSGNASTTAFTLSRPVAAVAQVEAVVNNVVQNPSSAYTVNGGTITFTSAPSAGTNNIYVRYTSPITQLIAPSQGTVTSSSFGTITDFTTTGNTTLGDATTDTLNVGAGGIVKDASGNVGIGVTPSTWTGAGATALQIGAAGASILGNSSAINVIGNAVYNSGWKYATTAGAGYYAINNGLHIWYSAASGTAGNAITFAESMRIDSSGNVGIGTSSPSRKLTISGTNVGSGSWANSVNTDTTTGSTGGFLAENGSVAAGLYAYSFGSSATVGTTSNNVFTFITNNTERMRIDTSGNLMLNTTSVLGLGKQSVFFDGSVQFGINIKTTYSTTNGSVFVGFYAAGGSQIGSITQATSTTVAYNTSSDYRLKENVTPLANGLTKVMALKPCNWTWKTYADYGEGFIAHELAEVCPNAVTGQKDAVDADGNPIYQGIDTSFLVATLTAAIQEQQALITALTARITALENK